MRPAIGDQKLTARAVDGVRVRLGVNGRHYDGAFDVREFEEGSGGQHGMSMVDGALDVNNYFDLS